MGPFETRRLRLDPLVMSDAAEIAALHGDPRIAAYLLDGIPTTVDHARIFINWAQSLAYRNIGVVAARRPAEHALIGLFSLTPFERSPDLELGGKLARGGWGSGLAFEAGARLIDHAFDTLGQRRLISAYHPDNRAVPAILSRLGFVPDGETRVFGRPAMRMILHRPPKRND